MKFPFFIVLSIYTGGGGGGETKQRTSINVSPFRSEEWDKIKYL